MTTGQRLRQLANVLNASTPLGLLLAACAGCSVRPGPRGLLIATGYRWRLPVAAAFTVGNVVLYRAGPAEAADNHLLLGHEERHSTQYACCFGVPFLPAYFLATAWSWWRTGNPGSANLFERHAGLQAGGYPPAFPGRAARKSGVKAGSTAPEQNEA
ncbi:hypothetical protein [Arthrobacter sp. B3I4]|uniref:hypothetical protein n=1 Tax=Arthrobacter sp. B3I4 TaxID=3042267 RepID=UPI00277D4871|nr:hypothetical protein [Arthrobacter sp. B3I4]MDQ0756884.1 hypothetical protein [Arthrobacter sp. B3I4]